MRGQDAAWNAVPIAGDDQRPLPDARGYVSRCAEGKRQCPEAWAVHGRSGCHAAGTRRTPPICAQLDRCGQRADALGWPDGSGVSGLMTRPPSKQVKKTQLPRNGLRPEVARWATRVVAEERQMLRDGTLTRLIELGKRRRRQLERSQPKT